MTTPIDNSNSLNKAFQIRGNASFLSKSGAAPKSGGFGQEMSNALDELSKLENSDQLRESAIKNGRAIIANWQPPTDQQIDVILGKMNSMFQ